MSTRLLAISGLALLITSAGSAASITSGSATFTINDASGFDTSPSADFTFGGADSLFEYGWWVRGPGDTQESLMGTPTTSTAGNQMTFTYSGLPGVLSFINASMLYSLTQSGNQATLSNALTLTNTGDAAITFSIFQMIDLDLSASSGNDSATGGLNGIYLTDPGGRNVLVTGTGAAAFIVRTFGASDVATLLSDASLTNFDNSGLPFGPGDYTSGFQWDITLNSAESITLNSQVLNSLDPLTSGVPEPSTFGMVGAGLVGLLALRRRKA